jgi:hypothetical protein
MATEIPIDTLRELLEYNPETGTMVWKVARSNRVKAGKELTNTSPSTGYMRVRVNKKLMVVHRVAWALATGAWPKGVIDHINGIKTDNRLCNLRDVTRADNCLNRAGTQTNKKIGDLGVFFDKRRGTWYAQICRHGKTQHLGVFASQQEASFAVAKARKSILGEVAYE